jgi:hypothetical protein
MVDMPNAGLPGAEVAPNTSAKMIVFGVSFSTTKEGFREYWAQYGELAECELMFSRDGRSAHVFTLCVMFGSFLRKPPSLSRAFWPCSPHGQLWCSLKPCALGSARHMVDTDGPCAFFVQIAWVRVRAVPR